MAAAPESCFWSVYKESLHGPRFIAVLHFDLPVIKNKRERENCPLGKV